MHIVYYTGLTCTACIIVESQEEKNSSYMCKPDLQQPFLQQGPGLNGLLSPKLCVDVPGGTRKCDFLYTIFFFFFA